MKFSKDFKEWALCSVIFTLLGEFVVWYVFQSDKSPAWRVMAAWLALPYFSVVYAVFIVIRPSEQKS